MALRIIGAGLPRTGTRSLKDALERLLGEPCYHMTEVFSRPDHVRDWHRAAKGEDVDWETLLDGWGAAVDFPASAFWPELAERWPDAPILLSHRDPAAWWRSADATVLHIFRREPDEAEQPFRDMVAALMTRVVGPDFLDADRAIAAAARHTERVRASVPASRLVEWTPGDGWEPLCRALGLEVPSEPYPHRNTTEEFVARLEAQPTGNAPQ